jgi:hypothetical protein
LGLRADYNSQFSYIYSSDYAGTSSHPLILTGTKTRSAAISQFWVDANNLVLGGIGSGNLIVNGTTNIYGETYLATKTGKVGIGTTSPGRRLSVNGTINISGPAEAKWTSNDWEKRIEIPNGGVIIWYKGAGTVARAMGQFSDGKFYIGRSTVDEGAGTLYVDMVINGSGYIGIGTSNPQTTLEVSSVIRSTPTDAPIACGAATEGGIYYDNSLNEFCDCNGTTPWWQIDNGGAC